MFILDCSVTLAWCFEDEASEYADAVLDHMQSQTALVPQLWHLEVLNVLLVGERRKRISAKASDEFFTLLKALDIQTDSLSHRIEDHAMLSLTRKYQLSSYDAVYLSLAERERLPLATADKKLRTVAQEMDLFFSI